jgi:hypothetical protein
VTSQFKELVKSTWESQQFKGWVRYILKDGLKNLKGVIKRWNGEVYGRPVEHKKSLMDQIKALDLKK